MLIRYIRTICGALVLLVGLPLLLAGGTLWFAMQHRDATGNYSASIAPIETQGDAVVVTDVDALLRQDVPVARAGQTTVRLSAQSDAGPVFVGLAPATEVGRYLADVPYTRIDRVRLARGPLPVETTEIGGSEAAEPPGDEPFWLLTNGTTGGALEFRPADLRGQQVALVVMHADAETPLSVDLIAQLRAEWLGPAVGGLLGLGSVLVLVAVIALAWPSRPREVVYVVPPAQVPEVAARLGLPYDGAWGGAATTAPATTAPATAAPVTAAPPVAPWPSTLTPEQRVSWAGMAPPEATSTYPQEPPSADAVPSTPPAWPQPAAASGTAAPAPAPLSTSFQLHTPDDLHAPDELHTRDEEEVAITNGVPRSRSAGA